MEKPKKRPEESSQKFYTHLENDVYKCFCGKVMEQKLGTGWSNLMRHNRSQHED